MADVNAKIGVSIDATAALAELKSLQRQLSAFHSSLAKGSAASVAAQKNLSTNLLNSINATGKFTAQMGLVRSSTESFTHALETNKLSMREYFRYAGGSTRTFGKLFKQEFNTIGKVAEERVKKMQTQYIKMGRDANGAIKAMSITPRTLDMNDYATKTALAAQKQALFNQLLKQGSTNLLNFGKNTQWAGRQLMVGFSIPLAYFGTAASKTFMDLEAQAIKFKRVYGDMFTTTDETNKALKDIQLLAESFTKYGVAVKDTMEMAASAAAMGKTGADLTAQVAEATRLAVLGGVEQAKSLETTISVTNAFGVSADELKNKINFLNAVENQTVLSIEDLTEAIPKAGPVVKQLGGSVEDLAFFMTAMKEGGINASEGANALKSGLASLINPTKKASEMLAEFGINIKGIVEANQGNIKNTVIGFAQALDTLDPLNRARAIEQLFGKFQFSRLSTLFQNVTKDGTQANKVLELTSASIEELAILSERELGTIENAVGTNFRESIEKLKLSIAPIGKTFLEAVTPIVKVIGQLLEKFDSLGSGTKKFIVVAGTLVGVIGPVLLMTFGLVLNAVANIIKLFATMRNGFLKSGSSTKILAEQTNYLNSEQLEAATVATSLNQAHNKLTQSFTVEAAAVKALRQAYIDATIAATNFSRANPGMMAPGAIKKGGKIPKKYAKGVEIVPGTGNKDNVPSLLTPGEAVLPVSIAQNPQYQPIIQGMMDGTLQAFGTGTTEVKKKASNTSKSLTIQQQKELNNFL
jgi:TP901 family phage tail tape measure protein